MCVCSPVTIQAISVIVVVTIITAVQSQEAVSAYFTSKQILPFDFVDHHCGDVVLCLAEWRS